MALFDLTTEPERLAKLAQLAADNKLLRTIGLQTRTQLEDANRRMFNIVWQRPDAAAIQEFLDTFTVSEQVELFTRHVALQTYLASQFADFVPLVPPYEFTWTETGIVIGELRS